MPCDLTARVLDIEAAYMALRARCAPDAPMITGDRCVVPFLISAWNLASSIAGRDGITELAPRPDIPECLSESFLLAMKAWIEGMTCEGVTPPADDGYYYLHLIYFISTEGVNQWYANWMFDGIPLRDITSPPSWNLYLNDIIQAGYIGPHWADIAGVNPSDTAEWGRMLSPSASKWMYVIERYLNPGFTGDALARLALVSNLTDWDVANASDPTVAGYRVTGTRLDGTRSSNWAFTLPEGIYATF